MCGIVGYIGNQNAAPILIEGLSRLEYRGYDSAGIAILGARGAQVYRRVGRVRDLEASLPRRLAGKVGIGHTRWATHGPATEENAHPQSSEDGRISVVHNGIIDNAASLRERLDAKGVKFSSDTDTDAIPHLLVLEQHIETRQIRQFHLDLSDRSGCITTSNPVLHRLEVNRQVLVK